MLNWITHHDDVVPQQWFGSDVVTATFGRWTCDSIPVLTFPTHGLFEQTEHHLSLVREPHHALQTVIGAPVVTVPYNPFSVRPG